MQLTFLVFLSLILISLGVVILISKINLDKLGVKAEGEIIDIIADREETINPFNNKIVLTVYKPLVKFKSYDGEEREVLLDIVNKGGYNIGDKINILYPSNKPSEVILNSKSKIYKLPTMCISLGIMFMIFAIVKTIL
ncbi:MAG: DUF3592 domain-containing protein [Clostridium sp.]